MPAEKTAVSKRSIRFVESNSQLSKHSSKVFRFVFSFYLVKKVKKTQIALPKLRHLSTRAQKRETFTISKVQCHRYIKDTA